MIRSLTGTIADTGENWVLITVHDIGYLVACPTLTNQFFINQTVTLYTYLAVRETALDLYGFLEKGELEMFELLLGVPKVGPKSALQILTQAQPSLLIEASQKQDGLYLHKLSGIGKKTAENIVRYLHGKTDRLTHSTIVDQPDTNQVQTDAIDALITLGYDSSTAREIIIQITDGDSTVNSLVTQALKRIQ